MSHFNDRYMLVELGIGGFGVEVQLKFELCCHQFCKKILVESISGRSRKYPA